LSGLVDEQQSSRWNWFGHKAIAPEIGYLPGSPG
jgi:hypothetical protein